LWWSTVDIPILIGQINRGCISLAICHRQISSLLLCSLASQPVGKGLLARIIHGI
jgi:hypothetical protein